MWQDNVVELERKHALDVYVVYNEYMQVYRAAQTEAADAIWRCIKFNGVPIFLYEVNHDL